MTRLSKSILKNLRPSLELLLDALSAPYCDYNIVCNHSGESLPFYHAGGSGSVSVKWTFGVV